MDTPARAGRVRLTAIGLIVANIMALGMTMSFYFVGRHVPPDYRKEFSRITKLQESGHFREAIGAYHDIHSRYGIESASLYYNIGNAYYSLDQAGRALQYYRKAQKLKPGDRQVRHNIRYVEKKLGVDNWVPETENGSFRKYFFRIVGFYSIYGWTIFSVANYWRFCIAIILLAFFGSKRRFFVYLALVLGIIFVVGLCFIGTRVWIDIRAREGVVLEKGVTAMYEHEDQGQTAFILKEGMMVRIVSQWRNWYEVRLNTGPQAWVKRTSIGEI